MNILLNNNPETIEGEQLTVNQLLELKKYTFKMILVKINNRVIKQQEYASALIREGDDVLVLHLMSGG
jgi:sulfur carrier protein